jgi:hypothetical protein
LHFWRQSEIIENGQAPAFLAEVPPKSSPSRPERLNERLPSAAIFRFAKSGTSVKTRSLWCLSPPVETHGFNLSSQGVRTMPYKPELTWISHAMRWRKRYVGHTYYLKTKVGGKSDREGY